MNATHTPPSETITTCNDSSLSFLAVFDEARFTMDSFDAMRDDAYSAITATTTTTTTTTKISFTIRHSDLMRAPKVPRASVTFFGHQTPDDIHDFFFFIFIFFFFSFFLLFLLLLLLQDTVRKRLGYFKR